MSQLKSVEDSPRENPKVFVSKDDRMIPVRGGHLYHFRLSLRSQVGRIAHEIAELPTRSGNGHAQLKATEDLVGRLRAIDSIVPLNELLCDGDE